MRSLLAAAIAAACLISPALADAQPQRRARDCNGTVYSKTEPTNVRVARGSTSCSTAKRILKSYFKSTAECEGSSCVRKHSGWTCQTASADAYPRVASCVRGRAVIEAWAIVD